MKTSRSLLFLAPAILLACTPKSTITNFQECLDAGHPIMESYPRQCAVPGGETFTEEIEEDLPITVESPQPNDTISETFTVKGEARGFWYFEASFPIKLLDSDGNILLEAPVQADADWMTTNFVPFEEEFTVDFNGATEGELVLQKDNPSGLPENDQEIRIPVNFQ